MSDMDIAGAATREDEEGAADGAEDYLHHANIMSRDRRTSGCAAGGNMQGLHVRMPDGSTVSDKGINGGLTARRCSEGEQRRMVDITRDKPIKVTVRIMVPVRDHPKFNFVGKLLGPKGNSLKRLQEDTMTKMAILGRGSMRDKHKEEELRTSGDPKFSHLNDDLHVEVTAFAPPAEAHARIAYALAEVRRFLVPDYNDEIRQEQMWEMQVLNTQRKPGALIGDILSAASAADQHSTNSSATSSDSRNGSMSPASPPPPPGADLLVAHELLQHPALRGCLEQQRCQQTNNTGSGSVCRKRPLLTGASNRLAMSPTKRTVLSILARARAAQAKELPDYHQVSNGRGGAISVLRDDISSGNLV